MANKIRTASEIYTAAELRTVRRVEARTTSFRDFQAQLSDRGLGRRYSDLRGVRNSIGDARKATVLKRQGLDADEIESRRAQRVNRRIKAVNKGASLAAGTAQASAKGAKGRISYVGYVDLDKPVSVKSRRGAKERQRFFFRFSSARSLTPAQIRAKGLDMLGAVIKGYGLEKTPTNLVIADVQVGA